MTNIFERYNMLTKEEKNELEDLYIIHLLFKNIKKYTNIKLTKSEMKILYRKVKECVEISNLNIKEVITRLLDMLNCADITIYNMNNLEIDEMIELLSEKDSDFKNIKAKKDIIFAITTNRFYCFLIRYEEQYIIVCEKNDGTQYKRKFKTLFDLAYYISRKFLQDNGEIYI